MDATIPGLGSYIKAFRDNGVIDIGLSADLDVGVPDPDFIRSLLKPVTLLKAGEEPVVVPAATNMPASRRLRPCDYIVVTQSEQGHSYTYRGSSMMLLTLSPILTGR